MHHLRLFLLLAYLWAAETDANLPIEGGCVEPIHYMKQFDMKKYLGLWYTHSRTPFFGEHMPRCIRQLVSQDKVTLQFSAKLSEILPEEEKLSISNVPLEDIQNGTFLIQIGDINNGLRTFVLDTDYTNYAVRYSCFDIVGYVAFISLVIQTRQLNTPQQYIKRARQVLKAAKMPHDQMMMVDHTKCNIWQRT